MPLAILHCNALSFRPWEFGWTSRFSGTHKSVVGIGSIAIVESLQQGETTSYFCNCNATSSSANTSCIQRLVHTFTCHVLSIIGQSNMYCILLPLTQRLMSLGQNHNLHSSLLVERYSSFNPLYVGTWVSCLLVPTLALHKVFVSVCITQNLWQNWVSIL